MASRPEAAVVPAQPYGRQIGVRTRKDVARSPIPQKIGPRPTGSTMMPSVSGVRAVALLAALLTVGACGTVGASRPPPAAAPTASGAIAATKSAAPTAPAASDERAVASFYQAKTVR